VELGQRGQGRARLTVGRGAYPSGITVAASALAVVTLNAAGGDTSSLVTYVYNYNVYGSVSAATERFLDSTPIAIATHGNSDRVRGGRLRLRMALTWQRYGGYSTGRTSMPGRVTSAGAPLDGTAGVLVSAATGHQVDPTVCFEGEEFLVAWSRRAVRVGLRCLLRSRGHERRAAGCVRHLGRRSGRRPGDASLAPEARARRSRLQLVRRVMRCVPYLEQPLDASS